MRHSQRQRKAIHRQRKAALQAIDAARFVDGHGKARVAASRKRAEERANADIPF